MSTPTMPSSSAVAAKEATFRCALCEGAKALALPRARREKKAVFMVISELFVVGKLTGGHFKMLKSQKGVTTRTREDRGIVSSMWSSAFGILSFMLWPLLMTRHLTPWRASFDTHQELHHYS
jgi:hypothetical protein